MKLTIRLKGGPGSGHHGHKGIPGHRGGSLPADGSASASQSSISASPKTAEAWAERLASKRSMWNLSAEDFATEVNDLLVEKFPELENNHDKLSDLVYSAVSQRVENMEEVDLQSTKLNRREVSDPNDKPGDLPGLRIQIPNKDGELSHGSVHEEYVSMFRDDPSNIAENIKILHGRRIASGEYDTLGQESQAQDAYEQVIDDIANQMYDIADKMREKKMTPSVQLLIRDYQKINGIKFNTQERRDLSAMVSEGSYQLENPIPD